MPTTLTAATPGEYVSPTGGITQELIDEIEALRQQQQMTGQRDVFESPNLGDDAMTYLLGLSSIDRGLAQSLGERFYGLTPEQFNQGIADVNAAGMRNRGSNVFRDIGELTRVGRGEAEGFGDFARDAGTLAAIGMASPATWGPGGGYFGGTAAGGSATGAPVGGYTGGGGSGVLHTVAPGTAGGSGAGAAGTLSEIVLPSSVAPITGASGAAVGPAATAFGPPTSALGAGGGGLGRTLGRMFGVRDSSGALDWSRIMELGGAGLSAINALGNRPEEAQPPARAPWMDAPLPNFELSRQQRPMDPNAYYTYGQTGGEHQFFTDTQPRVVSATQPAAEPIAVPEVRVPGRVMTPGQRFVSGGAVAGPGTGRSDDIPAQLSDGEYVIDAESVAMLGDGSSEAGAKKLDELRRRLRQHKGRALAKGKFSPDAKDPAEYMAKGGNIRALSRQIESRDLDEPTKEIQALRKLVQTIRERHLLDEHQRGYDPRNSPTPKRRKAEGGRVRGVNMLADYADKLEQALDLGDMDSQTMITRQIEAIEPRFKLAKGGNIRSLIKQIRDSMSPEAQRVKRMQSPPIRPPMTTEYRNAVRQELQRFKPNSPALRVRPTTGEQQLEGEELMRLFEKAE